MLDLITSWMDDWEFWTTTGYLAGMFVTASIDGRMLGDWHERNGELYFTFNSDKYVPPWLCGIAWPIALPVLSGMWWSRNARSGKNARYFYGKPPTELINKARENKMALLDRIVDND